MSWILVLRAVQTKRIGANPITIKTLCKHLDISSKQQTRIDYISLDISSEIKFELCCRICVVIAQLCPVELEQENLHICCRLYVRPQTERGICFH